MDYLNPLTEKGGKFQYHADLSLGIVSTFAALLSNGNMANNAATVQARPRS